MVCDTIKLGNVCYREISLLGTLPDYQSSIFTKYRFSIEGNGSQ